MLLHHRLVLALPHRGSRSPRLIISTHAYVMGDPRNLNSAAFRFGCSKACKSLTNIYSESTRDPAIDRTWHSSRGITFHPPTCDMSRQPSGSLVFSNGNAGQIAPTSSKETISSNLEKVDSTKDWSARASTAPLKRPSLYPSPQPQPSVNPIPAIPSPLVGEALLHDEERCEASVSATTEVGIQRTIRNRDDGSRSMLELAEQRRKIEPRSSRSFIATCPLTEENRRFVKNTQVADEVNALFMKLRFVNCFKALSFFPFDSRESTNLDIFERIISRNFIFRSIDHVKRIYLSVGKSRTNLYNDAVKFEQLIRKQRTYHHWKYSSRRHTSRRRGKRLISLCHKVSERLGGEGFHEFTISKIRPCEYVSRLTFRRSAAQVKIHSRNLSECRRRNVLHRYRKNVEISYGDTLFVRNMERVAPLLWMILRVRLARKPVVQTQESTSMQWNIPKAQEPSTPEFNQAELREGPDDDIRTAKRYNSTQASLTSFGGHSGISPTKPLYSPLGFHIPYTDMLEIKNASPEQTKIHWQYSLYKGPCGENIIVDYCKDKETTNRIAQKFLDQEVIGFDIEWKAQASVSQGVRKNVALIQLASEERIALFHIALYPNGDTLEELVAPSLKQVMESSNITKAGVSIKADCTRLRRFMGIDSHGLFELSHLYKLVKYSTENTKKINKMLVSLAHQVEEHFELPLWKGEVRDSDWTKELSDEQLRCKLFPSRINRHTHSPLYRCSLRFLRSVSAVSPP